MKGLVLMAVAVAVALAATALPFLPGRYDGLAVPLSDLARSSGTASLLLVPIGFLWPVYESRLQEGVHRGRTGYRGYYEARSLDRVHWKVLSYD